MNFINALVESGKKAISTTPLFEKLFSKKEGYYGSNRERVGIQKNLNMSRQELFLSTWNTQKLTREMFFNYRELMGERRSYAYFIEMVPKWMKQWKRLPVLDDFEDLRRNFVDTFVQINKIFIYDHLETLRENVNSKALTDINDKYGDSTFDSVTNEDVDLYYAGVPYYEQWDGDTKEGELNLFHETIKENSGYYNEKDTLTSSLDDSLPSSTSAYKMESDYSNPSRGQGRDVIDAIKQEAINSTPNRDDFYVEDYRNLDFWDNNYVVYRDNSNYRYHNQIPIYQKSMQKRHYDRASEGLRQRGSLVNDRQRKYDLSEIEEGFYFYPPMAGFPDSE